MPSAARVSWAKFRVFVVTLGSLSILFTLLFLLTGGTLLQPRATIYLFVPDVTGLAQDSPVRVDGIQVGKVKSVELSGSTDPNRVVRVTLRVERSRLATIPADSYAELSTESLIGDMYVDITSGRAARSIQPGAELPFRTGGLMKSLDIRQFEQRLRDMDALLTDIENGRSRVGQLVRGEEAYNGLKKRVAEIYQDIRATTSRNTQIGQALYTDKLYQQIRDPLARLDNDLAQLQSGQGSFGQMLTETAQYEQLRASIRDFTQTLSDVQKGDFFQSDASWVQWNRSLAGLVRGVDDFNTSPLLATSETYDSLNGFARELAGSLREFREDPRKFLRLKVF